MNKRIVEIHENHRRKRTQAIVLINESHSLLEDQQRVLEERYEGYEILPIPASGWTLEEMDEKVKEISSMELEEGKLYLDVIFVSPVPYMIRELTRKEIYMPTVEYAEQTHIFVHVFHNDRREKKELPGGKVIQVVAKEGWKLV